MLKLLVSLILLATGDVSLPNENCNCPAVESVEPGRSTGSIYTIEWDAVSGATAYEVWYYRQEGNYTSTVYQTPNTYFAFSNLIAGNYTFYVRAVCTLEKSAVIGVYDILEN